MKALVISPFESLWGSLLSLGGWGLLGAQSEVQR